MITDFFSVAQHRTALHPPCNKHANDADSCAGQPLSSIKPPLRLPISVRAREIIYVENITHSFEIVEVINRKLCMEVLWLKTPLFAFELRVQN